MNSILQGSVETEGTRALPEFGNFLNHLLPRTALGRVGQPEDIASVVLFLGI